MEQIFSFPKAFSLFQDEAKERVLQEMLDLLALKKVSWELFETRIEDIFPLSHLAASSSLRTLLHLAVIDHRLEYVRRLKDEPSLKSKRDFFGMSPLDLAKLLHRKEELLLLLEEPPLLSSMESIPWPYFETPKLLEDVLRLTEKAKKRDQIPPEKLWLGIYFDEQIESGAHAPVDICYINDRLGFGVFAKEKISSCSYVGEYAGKIVQKEPKYLKDKEYCLRYPVWGEKRNYTVDAEEGGNFTRYLNHSTLPNLSVESVYYRGVPRMIFISLKEIQKGEQLTFDYGPLFCKYSKKPLYDL